MNSTIACRPVSVVTYVALLLLNLSVGNSQETPRKADENPGYFQQWRDMKKDERGNIPRGLYAQWYSYDKRKAQLRKSVNLPDPIKAVDYLSPVNVGGRTRALLIDSANQDRLFAGAISGGLWRSDDRGKTWAPINDASVNLMVSSITQNPFDAKTIYYGTGEARANTAGVPGEGIFKSTDGGITFDQLAPTGSDPRFEQCWCVEHSQVKKETIFVGTESGGLMRSTDAGQSWTVVLSQSPVTDVVAFDDGSVLAAVSENGLYRSSSGDPSTFLKVNSASFPTGFNRIVVAENRANQRKVYAAFEGTDYLGGANAFCASDDRGLTWTPRTTPKTGAIYNRYCFLLGVHPNDANKVVCGGVNLKYSNDGGVTWNSASQAHADHHSFANFSDNPDYFLVGNDGGVYRYRWSNAEGAPDDLNDGYHVSQFYAGAFAPTGDLAIGGTQDNGTWKILGGSEKKLFGGDGAHCHVSLQDASIAYCSWQGGNMLKTTNFMDAEPIWKSINSNSTMDSELYLFINPFQINYADGGQLFCRTNKALWRTNNSGQTWERLTDASISGIYAIGSSSAANPTVYFGGSGAILYRIDDAASAGAGSEVDLTASVPASVSNDYLGSITVHPTERGQIYVSFTNFRTAPRAWKVTNADTASPTWTDISGDLPPKLPVNYIQADPEDPTRKIFVATDFGLYYTTDGGSTWVKETRIPNVSIHELKLRGSDRTLFLFTHGRGAWKVKLR